MNSNNNRATWIWYPGDFEVWLGNIFNNRRTERGTVFPPFWKQDSHWSTVVFRTIQEVEQEEVIAVWTEGEFNFSLDGKLLSPLSAPDLSFWYEENEFYGGYRIRIPAGRHELAFKVWNQKTPPALYVDGKTIKSSSQWEVSYEDKIWIDENGQAHGSGIYVPTGSWNFNEPGKAPSGYTLRWREKMPVKQEQHGQGCLYDFGREVFGHLDFRGPEGSGVANIYYGESREEALDKEHCETLDMVRISNDRLHHNPSSKAFRYVYIETTGNADYLLAMYEEYAPFDPEKSGTFRCSDEELNRIWEVSARTLELTTQEFFMDGIKRDRWVWSGDAIQSYLMNYYLHFDSECVKRTIRQLRGKDPVTAHVNTIMDYTFYWFTSIIDYYQYTGDADFIREIYPRMQSLMDYVLSRTNADGMAEGQPDDWIFVDWVDFPMHKRGALAFEQLLLVRALNAMASCASLLSLSEADRYEALASNLLKKTRQTFWSEKRHAFLHALEEGRLNPQITRFPNIFAILYGYASPQEADDILPHVLQNPSVDAITTPYMRFYELAALCQMGQHGTVLSQIKAYWGGMLNLGATSFWEKYNPHEQGAQHLAMYGRPYGKSLCHAWGASPLYLLGRYFLGVHPTAPGFSEYEVRPVLGGLKWMQGSVPTPFGLIRITMDDRQVSVHSDGGLGTLVLPSRRVTIPAGQTISCDLLQIPCSEETYKGKDYCL